MFRYIGNKTKLIGNILTRAQELIGCSGTIADVMAGTGCVSSAFRKNGYSVVASDIMTYSYHHLVSTLLISESPLFRGLRGDLKLTNGGSPYELVLTFLNSLEPIQGFFYKEYSSAGVPLNGAPARKYFTPANAAKIDSIRKTINDWKNQGKLSSIEESLLKHTLIMSVNDVANISGTYGYFLSSYKKNAIEPIVLQSIGFDGMNTKGHRVLQGFAEDLSPNIEADLCYLDPPYMKRQYAANYHILETLAQGDSPTNLIGKSGLRDWWGQHSKLCTKTQGLQSFEKIISSMKCDKFLISYSEDGLFSLNELCELFARYGEIDVRKIEYNRFRSNGSLLSKTLEEYLISIER